MVSKGITHADSRSNEQSTPVDKVKRQSGSFETLDGGALPFLPTPVLHYPNKRMKSCCVATRERSSRAESTRK
jgi:hypothetical protein